MKALITILLATLLTNSMLGQVSGNINYQNQVRYPDHNINISFPQNDDLIISVKGLANVTADSYVAIFSVAQAGKTTEEVNRLIDERIKQALQNIDTKAGVETYVDMISFIPVYEYEVEKKVFSKKTYHEVPVGFELKKNIHIKYSDPKLLNELITHLSNAEIYDLVRVDYFSNDLEAIKKELMTKAKTILQEKFNNYQSLLSVKLDSAKKEVVDGYNILLPVEMYKSYQAYNSSSLNVKNTANINQADKSVTLYYQPVIDKEFDFVINPTILEPVIQVLYQVKLKVHSEEYKTQKSNKEYILISPNGELKNLNIN